MEKGEVFSDTKQRLSDLTKIKGKQFDKIKFSLLSRATYSKPELIEDGEFVQWTESIDVPNVQQMRCYGI